ncbi:MAG: hypothetical protein LBT84_06310 [Spirochaetia bacterium]|nr:hypothetical protein [Spirochaetia bacterium]
MNNFTVFSALLACSMFFSCGGAEEPRPDEKAEIAVPEETPGEPVTFSSINGQWYLMYPEDLGYELQFYKNFRSLIILYLGNHALLFKGVYNIEDGGRVRINIYEMKRSESAKGFNRTGGFIKAKSSYFLLQCHTVGQKQEQRLIVRPVKIVIDGNNSDGYLEPVLRLKKR